ncbi:trehalose-phosphatase [Ochrobactrum vermis]|uniref:Trehalose 6-phosphate phosphatase n=1 Tax=Ochrobactrum vermis TaxID=1827297 RepID=A0ABU8PLT5_9HYPH|nr:trehalose-phosphatase [Ochrobactrum vermis]
MFSAHLHGDRVALLLDIDGTLVNSITGPELLSVDDGLRTLLVDLHEMLGGALCLVTGRSLAKVDEIFGDVELPTFGFYGLERRIRIRGPKEISTTPRSLLVAADRVKTRLHDIPDLIFRSNGAVLVVDTRFAPEAKPQVEQALAEVLPIAGDHYVMVVGHRVVELAPEWALKSIAIGAIMRNPPFQGRLPIFIGDDAPDESGFGVVNEMGGISIRVNPQGPSAARYTLPGVLEVRSLLAKMLSERRCDLTPHPVAECERPRSW